MEFTVTEQPASNRTTKPNEFIELLRGLGEGQALTAEVPAEQHARIAIRARKAASELGLGLRKRSDGDTLTMWTAPKQNGGRKPAPAKK